MTKTIAQLWNGNLVPISYLDKNNPEIKQLEGLIHRNLQKLKQTLNKDNREAFEKYNDCINEYITITNEQVFCDGFCLGAKMTAEAVTGAEQIAKAASTI